MDASLLDDLRSIPTAKYAMLSVDLCRALMPIYSIPRRSFREPHDQPPPLNWRRGMFRIWLLVSSAWVMGWIIHLTIYAIGGGLQTAADVLAVPVLLFLPPIALLIFCVAAAWAMRGFQT